MLEFSIDNDKKITYSEEKRLVKIINVFQKYSLFTSYKIYIKFEKFGNYKFILEDAIGRVLDEYEPDKYVIFSILEDIRRRENGGL